MGGFLDFLRMILGWKSAVPPAPFTGEGIIVKIPQMSYTVIVRSM